MRRPAFSITTAVALVLGAMAHASAQDPLADYLAPAELKAAFAESHALIIGNSNYRNGWRFLAEVPSDVDAVSKTLRAHGFTIHAHQDLTAAEIHKVLDNFLRDHGGRSNKDNRLLIYFAGHGHTMPPVYSSDSVGYIVGIDAAHPNKDPDGFVTGSLDMGFFELYAKRLQARHVLFVFDACFAGSIFTEMRSNNQNLVKKALHHAVREFITSGSANEEVPDRSVFRREFVRVLNGEANYDPNDDGFLTGEELALYLRGAVTAARKNQNPRHGKLSHPPELAMGDFVFQLPGERATQLASLRTTEKGSQPAAAAADLRIIGSLELVRAQFVSSLLDPLSSTTHEAVDPNDLAAEQLRGVTAAPVLYYTVSKDTTHAWLLANSQVVAAAKMRIPRDSLAALVNRAFGELMNPGNPKTGFSVKRYLNDLAGILFPTAIQQHLPADGELVIIPDDRLVNFPFSALTIPGQDSPIGLRYGLRYAPSLTELIRAQQRPTNFKGSIVFANPAMPTLKTQTGAAKLPPLPGATREGRVVAQLLNAELFEGPAASETRFRTALAESPRVLHVATHAQLFANPRRVRSSYIAFAPDEANDGLLTLGDLLDLEGNLGADLVIVSSIDAVYDADATVRHAAVDFARVFLMKGARTVLVTSEVGYDEAIATFIELFYKHLRDAPSKAEALRRTQLEMSTIPSFSDQRYWALFQLVGAN